MSIRHTHTQKRVKIACCYLDKCILVARLLCFLCIRAMHFCDERNMFCVCLHFGCTFFRSLPQTKINIFHTKKSQIKIVLLDLAFSVSLLNMLGRYDSRSDKQKLIIYSCRYTAEINIYNLFGTNVFHRLDSAGTIKILTWKKMVGYTTLLSILIHCIFYVEIQIRKERERKKTEW